MFLDEGILITTSGRNGAQVGGLTAEIRATHDTPFRDLPVAVLTSSRTASGSELLAASLRNHDRALLVGERTFGKGTVQKTYALGTDSSLKMTVGHFLPNGLAIPGGGLTPDVELRTFVFDDGIVWPPDERSAEKLPFWLRMPGWLRPTQGTPKAVLTSWEEAKTEQEESTTSADDDVVVLAAALLDRFGSTSAERMLDVSANWLAARAAESDTALRNSFGERGIDWRAPSTVASAASISSRPASARSSVVLPAPSGPTMPKIWRSVMSRSIPASAWRWPKRLRIPRSRMTGASLTCWCPLRSRSRRFPPRRRRRLPCPAAVVPRL